MRNKNLVQSIREEDVAILNLKVKLRVLPFSKELQVEQDWPNHSLIHLLTLAPKSHVLL